MTIHFDPRISGNFVKYVLGDDHVKEQVVKSFGDVYNEQDLHDLAKSILIKAFTCFEVDINSIINNVKDKG